MNRFYTFSFFCICLGLSLSLSAQVDPAWQQKVAPALLLRSSDSLDCIIRMQQQGGLITMGTALSKTEKGKLVFNSLRQTADSSQKDLLRYLRQQQIPHHSLWIVNALQARIPTHSLPDLAKRRDIAFIHANDLFRKALSWEAPAAAGRSDLPWGIEKIRAPEVWEMGFRGQGVVVGGQDTGYDWTHPALRPAYRGAQGDSINHNYNWHDAIHSYSPLHDTTFNKCGLDISEPCDDGRHGTHTMGIMIGREFNGEQVGVAPAAQWIGLRNMERGYGSPFTYLEGFQWFLAPTDLEGKYPRPELAPHVINNSWYCPELEGCDSTNIPLLDLAVTHLKAAGIVVVVSAGNAGDACLTINQTPASFESSFAVGATDEDDALASFSSRGPVLLGDKLVIKPNISAPGVRVRSTVPDSAYRSLSGTSMAGPHVAGTVALMISANPSLAGQVDLIETILEQTALGLTRADTCSGFSGLESPNPFYGYGRIDALEAVLAALNTTSTEEETTPTLNGIRLYPNPSNGLIFIEGLTEGKAHWKFFNSQGQLVGWRSFYSTGSPQRFELQELPTGLYYYSIQQGDHAFTGKVVLE